jgi:hypothetical protein
MQKLPEAGREPSNRQTTVRRIVEPLYKPASN